MENHPNLDLIRVVPQEEPISKFLFEVLDNQRNSLKIQDRPCFGVQSKKWDQFFLELPPHQFQKARYLVLKSRYLRFAPQ